MNRQPTFPLEARGNRIYDAYGYEYAVATLASFPSRADAELRAAQIAVAMNAYNAKWNAGGVAEGAAEGTHDAAPPAEHGKGER